MTARTKPQPPRTHHNLLAAEILIVEEALYRLKELGVLIDLELRGHTPVVSDTSAWRMTAETAALAIRRFRVNTPAPLDAVILDPETIETRWSRHYGPPPEDWLDAMRATAQPPAKAAFGLEYLTLPRRRT